MDLKNQKLFKRAIIDKIHEQKKGDNVDTHYYLNSNSYIPCDKTY